MGKSNSRETPRKPQVVTNNRQLPDITNDVLNALYESHEPRNIYCQSNALSRIVCKENARSFAEFFTEPALRGELSRCCDFIKHTAKGESLAVFPPPEVVRDILGLGKWAFPSLLGIIEAPGVRPDGSLIIQPGYDSQTQLYYSPSPNLSVPPIPDKPTINDVKEATELIKEIFADFPFDSDASRATAIAALLNPIVRSLIDGPTPLHIFDKNERGTGASKAVDVISITATGQGGAMMRAPKDEESMDKLLTSTLIRAEPIAAFDNVKGKIVFPSLAICLTATYYSARILGKSEKVLLPIRNTWIATGNNITTDGDLIRRCVYSRMDAKMARPWLRDPKLFRHPNLLNWVSVNRGEILAKILTIVRAWKLAGMPEDPSLPQLGSYESYRFVMGGILHFMGIQGFLGNLGNSYDDMDIETAQWAAFLEVWVEVKANEFITVAELLEALKASEYFKAALPENLADDRVLNYNLKIGISLRRYSGVYFANGLKLTKGPEKHHAATWQVVDTTSPTTASQGNSGRLI